MIGTNAIIIYLASSLVDWKYIAQSVFGGLVAALPQSAQALAAVISLLAVQWLVCSLGWLLLRRRPRQYCQSYRCTHCWCPLSRGGKASCWCRCKAYFDSLETGWWYWLHWRLRVYQHCLCCLSRHRRQSATARQLQCQIKTCESQCSPVAARGPSGRYIKSFANAFKVLRCSCRHSHTPMPDSILACWSVCWNFPFRQRSGHKAG